MSKTIAHPPGTRKARAARRRRALGQHFLLPGGLPDSLLREFAPAAGEAILEVGPGRGILTRGLLSAGARVLAVEVDERLASRLRSELAGCAGLRVVRADLLEVDLRALLRESFGDSPARCLSSLPYSSGTAILERLCDAMPPLTEVVVLLQKEVVERVLAPEGTPEYGYLSVAVRSRCEARGGRIARPGAFAPPPRVLSQILRLSPLADPPVRAAERAAFLRLVGQLFTHRRKTLANNLRAAGLGGPALSAAGAVGDPRQRPGEWSVERLAALHSRLLRPAGGVLK